MPEIAMSIAGCDEGAGSVDFDMAVVEDDGASCVHDGSDAAEGVL
jgi:hypothetical protein